MSEVLTPHVEIKPVWLVGGVVLFATDTFSVMQHI